MIFAIKFLKSFGCGKEQRSLLTKYLKSKLGKESPDDPCLRGAIKWLCLAQDASRSGGISAAYYFGKSWDVPYPETSGYAIATFLAYDDLCNEPSLFQRSLQIGDWELKMQTVSGGILSSPSKSFTRVFNTAQVCLGWCLLHERTQDPRYLHAALKAGGYLLDSQESDGRWLKDTYCGSRTYHARVDWSLLRLAHLSGDKKYARAAILNLYWVIHQATETGWYRQCGFDDDQPLTHLIGYTLRGLLECHNLGHPDVLAMDILPRLEIAADFLCDRLRTTPLNGIPGMLHASFDNTWNSSTQYSCLTGNAQLACFLYRLAQITKKPEYADSADILVSALKRVQLLSTPFPEINGAMPGSYPIFVGYMRNAYPNWAAKFFADALIMKGNYLKGFVLGA